MSMQNIEHVVVLMLENRSFDSMLGWLYENDAATANYFPDNSGGLYRGLQPPFDPNQFINEALNGTLSATPTRGVQGFTVPDVDPGEEYEHVNKQFYNTETPSPGAPITMTGVMADYVGVLQSQGYNDTQIIQMASACLQAFTPGQLPVLNQLAKHYAVSDDWFASVPSQTNPNRSFLMCGTSNGMVNNGELETNPEAKKLESVLGMAIGDDRVNANTIFNAINESGDDWNVFWQTSYLPHKITNLLEGLPILIPILVATGHPALATAAGVVLALLKPYTSYLEDLTSDELKSCYTWRLFPYIKDKIPNAEQHFQRIDQFHAKARAGQLPKFSYIEPFWSISHTTNPKLEALFSVQGNDYHPPGNTLIGEEFLKEVYTSLISNKAAWDKTMLVITFDEFVGVFDHRKEELKEGVVAPPWGINGQPPYQNPYGFKFNRLGARVPTIVVSPYVKKQTVFRSESAGAPYDHSSLIATALKWMGQESRIPEFGARAEAAPTFEGVLTLDQPRTDEADLAFLEKPRAIGDLVQWGDAFVLKNQNGRYLSSAYTTVKAVGGGSVVPDSVIGIMVDLGLAAHFPTMGGNDVAKLTFLTQSPDPPAQIKNNTELLLVTRESSVGAHNILGAWKDSHDCYYYDEYLIGDNAKQEKWILQKNTNVDQPLRYGDQIYLSNAYFPGQRLMQDDRWFESGWVTTGSGDYWTVEPAIAEINPVGSSWNDAPNLMRVAASQQGGPRGAQLWGIDMDGQLRSTFQETPGGTWSTWSGAWNGDVFPAKLISFAAAQQNNGVVQAWALDQNNDLFSITQTAPGGNWTPWSEAGWNVAPKLKLVTASQQGGSRGAQVWGIDTNGLLRSSYQLTPGGSWSSWSGVWNNDSPDNLISIAAAQQNNGCVWICVLDTNFVLSSNTQPSPGGDWSGWMIGVGNGGTVPLKSIAIAQQGGSRGAQLWGITTDGTLISSYQQAPGANWSPWSGRWNGDSPENLISVTAAQQNNGTVRIWAVDANHILYSNAQTSPGGNWSGWTIQA